MIGKGRRRKKMQNGQIHIENSRITMLNNFSKVLDVLMGVKNVPCDACSISDVILTLDLRAYTGNIFLYSYHT